MLVMSAFMACEKLGVDYESCQIVDEADGSVIDEDEVLLEMKGSVIMLLGKNDVWNLITNN